MRFAGAAMSMVLLSAAPAAAQMQLQLSGALSAGATDNALSMPTGAPGMEGDIFTVLRAGLGVLYDHPRAPQRLLYSISGFRYWRAAEATLANQLLWRGVEALAPSVDLGHHVDVNQGRMGLLDPLAPVSLVNAALPAGDTAYVYGSGVARLEWRPTAGWGVSQSVSATGFTPTDGGDHGVPRSGAFDARLAAGTSWRRSSFGLSGRGGYAASSAWTSHLVGPVPARELFFLEGLLGWSYGLFPTWSLELAGGVLGVERLEAGSSNYIGPAGRAGVIRRGEQLELIFEAARTVRPNVFLGDTYIADSVGLRVAHPWGEHLPLQIVAAGGWIRSNALAADGSTLRALRLWYAEASLAWAPRWRKYQVLARYRFVDQDGSSAIVGEEVVFRRSVFMLTFVLTWWHARNEPTPLPEVLP